ncbi:MAG: hypothetical protein OQK04_16095, partial [Kangiellaceae bacterium]|nr:hypothetical protein [Kangiellaceae bacterium]
RWWEKDIRVYGITPCLVAVPSLSESEIDVHSKRRSAKVNRLRQLKQDIFFKVLNAIKRKFLIRNLKSLV